MMDRLLFYTCTGMDGLLIVYTGIAIFAWVTYFWITKTKSGRKWARGE